MTGAPPCKKPFYRTRVRSLGMLVTNSLTHSCLVNLIDVTLACEDANSKLVEVVTVADVSDEDRMATVCCRSGRPGLVITLNFCSDFEQFCQDFEVEVQLRF